MASTEQHAAAKAEGAPSMAEGVGQKEHGGNETGGAHKEHDYVMVGEDSSREQSSCPTPVGTPLRAMLQGDQLQVSVPSTNISPQTVFGSLDPKSLAALQAAFHDSFAGEGQESKEPAGGDSEALPAVTESDEGLVAGQSEVRTPVPSKEPKAMQEGDSSPEIEAVETPDVSPKASSGAAPVMKERLEEAQKEIGRLRRALEEGTAQQEWMLGNVVKSTAAEKQELTHALQAMQDECNVLELELKHHEKEFADLVSEELEQRFTRFEEVTLSAVQKLVGIISSPADARPVSLAAGMDFSALSMPGGTLTAHLVEVAPNMTLLEALQTREAQDMLSALEAARAPCRHPLDISLQARARLNSAVSTLYASARRRTCFRSRMGGAMGSARRHIVRGAQGAAGAFARAGNAVDGGLNHTARYMDNATDRAAAAAKHGVKAGAVHAKQAAETTGCWMRDNMKKEKLGHAARQVPSTLAAPFKAFAQWSLYLDAQRRKPEVKQVLGMYMEFAAAGFCLAVFSGVVWMGSVMVHDVREERQAAYFRRHEKELELKGQLCDMETTLTIERARAEEAEKAAAKAERRMQQAVREARRAEREVAKARALEDGAPADIVDLGGSPTEAKGDDDGGAIWRMEPEELFGWNGFPNLDLRGVINKICNRCK